VKRHGPGFPREPPTTYATRLDILWGCAENNDARHIFWSQAIELILVHILAAISAIDLVFPHKHPQIYETPMRMALTSLKQLFKVAHVDG